MKIYCNWTSGHVSFIWLPLFGKVNSTFASWISPYLIYGDPVVCLFSVFASFKYIYWVLFSFYRTPEDRTKLALNLHSWKNDLSQTNCLVLLYFWCTTFFFLSLCYIISSGDEKIIRFLLFWIGFMCASRLYFLVFS